jgi:hypothetical protein
MQSKQAQISSDLTFLKMVGQQPVCTLLFDAFRIPEDGPLSSLRTYVPIKQLDNGYTDLFKFGIGECGENP